MTKRANEINLGHLETIQAALGNDLATPACYPPANPCQRTSQVAQPIPMTSPSSSLQLSGSYRAYLVRMWQEHPQSPWRASVHNAQTGEKRVFSDLEQLVAFLYAQTQADTPAAPGSPNSSP
ncbi:MAG: hypothetical protein DCC55_14205 [Chloroflexi bacterium]|nr:MAG: hypothetical protein DCC55_14205 [Chloroflexota bacterium]